MNDDASINSLPAGPLLVTGGIPVVRKTAVHSEHGEPLAWQTAEPLTVHSPALGSTTSPPANYTNCPAASANACWSHRAWHKTPTYSSLTNP